MSDDIAKLEFQRMQLAASLSAVAESMRNCVSLVENFASSIQNSQISPGLSLVHDDGLTKGKKRKAVDHEDETDPKKRKRKPRDPNAPKRPASSYILFQNDIRKQLKEKHPNVPNNELLAMISKQWNEMPDHDKEHYHKAVADAKEQYSLEKKAYDNRTPEEVAAANAAVARAQAEKKTKGRTPKAPAAPPAAAPVRQPAIAETSPSSVPSESSDSGESSEEEEVVVAVNGKAVKAKQQLSSDSDEEDEEEDEEEEEEEEEPPITVMRKGKGKVATAAPVATPARKKRAGKA